MVSTAGTMVSLKTELRFPIAGQQGHGSRNTHLTKKCKMRLANPYPGIYNISGDIFPVQILITGKVPPEIALYVRCLTDHLQAGRLVDQLTQDYMEHQSDPLYEDYMDQLINANLPKKGESPMCCEGIFRLYGTSSKEIAEKAVAPVLAELNKTTEDYNTAKKENDYLKQLLDQHGIAYNC